MLRSAVVVASGSVVGNTQAVSEGIPEPYSAIPTIDDPTPRKRQIAQGVYPPPAVPDAGAIPDPNHYHTPKRELRLPQWVIDTVAWRLSQLYDESELTPDLVVDFLFEYAYLKEQFRAPDGRDAVGVVLSRVRND
ncbi:hypothetical protein DJ71_02295 [Halorubrum sp. E3]|nr:hypothetical protein DJ71_02295 [Halorubrum sp. E3]